MKAHHKRKKSRLYLQEYLPPVIKEGDIERRKIAEDIIANNFASVDTDSHKRSDKKALKEYMPPTIDVILVEMENGIAANSGFALPVKAGIQVDETWDNADIKPDQPIYW